MWDEIVKKLPEYESAVLTVVGEDGYPFSIRFVPTADAARKGLRLELSNIESIRQGRVGLLWHKHNEKLFDMSSFGVRGSLERDEGGWYVLPEKHIPGAALGITDLIKMVRGGRHTAKRYLSKRGLSRPKIPWDTIQSWFEDKN